MAGDLSKYVLQRVSRKLWTTSRQKNVSLPHSSEFTEKDLIGTRPVQDIPGPPALPYFGTVYKHLPGG